MAPRRRTLSIVAVLAVVVLTAGCLSGLPGDDSGDAPGEIDGMSADELQESIIETMDGVETGAMAMEMSVEADGESMTMSTDGVMDISEEKMHMTMNIEMYGQTQEMESYVVGDTQYVELDGQWFKEDISNQNTWSENFSEQQGVLEEAEILYEETTTVDGHEVYVLTLDADEDVLEDAIESQQGAEDPMAGDQADISAIDVTLYVDTETHHIRQEVIEMDYEVQGQEATASMTISYDNFDEPVDIELPEEAEDAPEAGTGSF